MQHEPTHLHLHPQNESRSGEGAADPRRQESATLFVPPELYQQMVGIAGGPPTDRDQAQPPPYAYACGDAAQPEIDEDEQRTRVAAAPPGPASDPTPLSSTMMYPFTRGRQPTFATLVSPTPSGGVPATPTPIESRVAVADAPFLPKGDASLRGAEPAPAARERVCAHAPTLAVDMPGVFTANGTIMMQAMPMMRPPAAPQPESLHEATPDSIRVRRALDEMSMVVDLEQMQRRVATASDDEMARYVDALRRSEGIMTSSAASPPAEFVGGAPSPAWAPQNAYPSSFPPPADMAPHPSSFPPPYGGPVVNVAPLAAGPLARRGAAKPASTAAIIFALMFLMTLAGVGALTYVALRSGHVASTTQVTTGHAVD